MKMRIVFALLAGAALVVGCSDPRGGGTTTASTGLSGSSGESGSGSAGSNGSGSVTGSSGATNGASTTGTETSGSNGSSGAQATCIGGRACTYNNDCGGSQGCLYHDGEPGCCEPTSDTCQNGSAAFVTPCAPGWVADTGPGTGNTDCCVLADGGTGGGTNGGTGGTTGTCVFDGGISGGQCSPDCGRGFHCVGGECVLNGGNGPIQVTLRWGQGVDLDLHVIEPNSCEIYYGDTNRGFPSSCGAVGSLDLDSNPGCALDNVDIENVIYPGDGGPVPASGTYTVRVDNYEDDPSSCAGGGRPIPYQVIVRHNGITDTYCESFPANSSDQGSRGSGVTIGTFTYP